MTKSDFRIKVMTCANTAHNLGVGEFEPKSDNKCVEIDTQDIGTFIYFLKEEFGNIDVKIDVRDCGVLSCFIYFSSIYAAFKEVVDKIDDGLNWAFP